MRRARPLILFLLFVAVYGCSHTVDLTRTAGQDNVGVEMARMNLWREAMFRFHRAVQLNPADAMAHNNLAVALEANGDFDNAAKEYREALKLDRTNPYIQKNYSRYTEFMSRSKKRQQQQRRDVTAAATGSTASPVAGTAGTPGAAVPGIPTSAPGSTPPGSTAPAPGGAAAPPTGGTPPATSASPAAPSPPSSANPPAPPPASAPPQAAPPAHPGGAQ